MPLVSGVQAGRPPHLAGLVRLRGIYMGEGLPGGVLAVRALDAEGARAALLQAGATCDLEGTLQQAAEILQRRFAAGFVTVCQMRQGKRLFAAPAAGSFSLETFFPGGEDFVDREFIARFTREDSGYTTDLETQEVRSPGQQAAFAAGIRSSMWAAVRDERGAPIGFLLVCSTLPNAFSRFDVQELAALSATLAWFARPAMLLEEQAAERLLLGQEATLLAAMAESESELELIHRVAEGVLEAAAADVVLLMVESPSGGPATLLSAPSDALTESQWAAARTALRSGKNGPFSDRSRVAGAFALSDLDTAETPLEEWMRDSLRMNSLAAATRSHHWGGLGLGIAALRRRPGGWTEAQRTFLARLARVFEISVERLRRGEIAIDHALRLEEQADILGLGSELLEVLSTAEALETACNTVSGRLRDFFSAEHVAFGLLDLEERRRTVLGFSSEVMRAEDFEPQLTESDVLAYRQAVDGHAVCFSDLSEEEDLHDAGRAMLGRGIFSILRAPFRLSDGTLGMVTLGSKQPGRYTETDGVRLVDLCRPLSIAIERARAVTSLRLQTQRTQAVLDILAALGPADSFEQLAGPMTNALRLMYGADHCAIGSFEGELVRLAGIDSSITEWLVDETAPRDSLLGSRAADGPVVHVISDLSTMPVQSELAKHQKDRGMRSSMRVLFGSPVDPLGIVTIGSRTPGHFTEADARQLAQIVQPLAVAARYFQGKREAEQRTERLETTNRILTRLSAGGTPEHLARGFLAECRLLFGSLHALAVQFDQETGTGRLLAVDTGLTSPLELPTEFALQEMHSARLVHQPTPDLVLDARLEREPNERHRHLIESGMYSAIRAPLVVHETVRGAVSLWGEGAGAFTAEDAELLGTLTRPLALALEKASALESLGESELKYRSLVAQADEMIFLFDPISLRLLDANSCTSTALGYLPEELIRLGLDRLIDADLEEISRNVSVAVTEGELHLTDIRFLRKDGSSIEVEAVASMVTFGGRQAVLVLARDVSERRALLRQLIQSQKMDSLGAMAGAVAHDFNNLLTTILGFAGLLKRSRNLDIEERENLALIEDAARRAADLTGRLLSFSRGGLVRFGRVDIRTVVEDTLSLTEPTMHARIRVTRSTPAAPVLVEGDSGQLQQALTNIVLNARDAMPDGGEIRLSLAIEGAAAVVRITDDGPGMDEETRMRIFEPFYTTKPVGSGTGLGMAITYGIIQGHHGDISVLSHPGGGTAFTISLPLLDYADDEEPVDTFKAGEGNLVLVVDDDHMVRRTTTATLAELGYNVVEAAGGSTAVEILRARPDRFSAVLLDLVMPG